MTIKGIEGMSSDGIRNEIARGGKFVFFTWCFSIIILTSRKTSDIYFVRAGESPIKYGWPWLLLSLFFGWWGIPWGPVYTIQAIYKAFSGNDVTDAVMQQFDAQHAAANPIQGWDNFNSNQ